jgi:hypothetical protein
MIRGKSKELKMQVTAGFPYNNSERRWEFSIEDATSHLLIAKVSLSLEQFALLMSGLACIEGTGVVWDSFDRCGLFAERKRVAIQDDRLKTMTHREQPLLDAVLTDHRSEYEVDGWQMLRVFSTGMSQGQLNYTDGTLRVDLVRYVEQEGKQ